MALINNAKSLQYSGFLSHNFAAKHINLKAAESQVHYDDDDVMMSFR